MIKALQGEAIFIADCWKNGRGKVRSVAGFYMKPKRKRRSPKKGRGGKILFLLILIGIGLMVLFHQQIYHSIKPLFERWGILVEKREVLLYFSDAEGEYLVGEKREILKKNESKRGGEGDDHSS